MNAPATPAPAAERIPALEFQLAHHTLLLEEMLTHKVYHAAYEKLMWIMKLFIAVGLLLAGAVGYHSYQQIVKQGSEDAARLFAEQAVTEVANEARRQADEQLTTLSAQFKAEVNAKVDQQAAEVLALYQHKYEQALAKVSATPSAETAVSGFVLFGDGHANAQGEWVWGTRSFKLEGADPDALPKAGNRVVSVKPALVREQAPHVSVDERKVADRVPVFKDARLEFRDQAIRLVKTPQLADSGGTPIATLAVGREMKVESVDVLLDRFVWVKVSSQP